MAVACPGCGAETGRVHGYHERTAADVSADGRRVVLKVRARRMRCPARCSAAASGYQPTPLTSDSWMGLAEAFAARTGADAGRHRVADLGVVRRGG